MRASQTTRHQQWLLIFVAIIFVGVVARLTFLGDKALGLDEAYSVWFSSQAWGYLWREVPQFETHPSLYYSFLKLWRGLGSDEFTLRLLSALANLATIPMVALAAYFAAPIQHRLPLAVTAGFLFTVSAVQQEYAQQARPYALLIFGMSLTLASSLWILTRADRSRRSLFRFTGCDRAAIAAYLGLGIGMAMLMWMHNLGVVFVTVTGAVLMAWWISQSNHRGPLFMNLLSAALLAVALYAHNIPMLVLQTQSVSESFWLRAPSFAQTLQVFVQVYGQLPLPQGANLLQFATLLAIATPLAVLGLVGTWRFCDQAPEQRWVACLLLATALGPVLLILILTFTVKPVFMLRTVVPVQVPWMIICAAAPFAVPQRWSITVWRILFALGLVSVISFSVSGADEERRDRERPWRQIVEQIAGSNAPEAPVIVLPNDSGNTLEYYNSRLGLNLRIQPLPGRYPVRGPDYVYPAGGAGVPAMDATAQRALDGIIEDADTVWLVVRFENGFDPEGIVRRSLSLRFPCATDFRPGAIKVTRFDRFTGGSNDATCQ